MAIALLSSLNKVFDSAMNAKMIGSTLTSFVGEVSEASKQDIQDCLLYAQLYADRGGGAGTWPSNYQYALLSLGFSLKAYIIEQPLLISDAHQVRDYKVQVAGVGNSERLANLLGVLFDTLHLERDALSYLNEPPITSHATHYQCAPCERTQQGELVVFVCALQLSCTPHDKNPALTFVRLNSKGGSFQFDAAVYAAMKNEVQDVIRDFTNTMIQNVEL